MRTRCCGYFASSVVSVIAGVLMSVFLAGNRCAAEDGPRDRVLLDSHWKFHLGNDWGTGEDWAKAGASRGPAGRSFSDTTWRTVDLPHDWAIELPFDENADASHGFKPVGPGFPTNSVGWYRKTFALSREDAGKRLWLEFDGVFRDCGVFVNGYFVGHHESGYSSFRYDITDIAHSGGDNVVAVRVDASAFEGWFYEGAGIYRHVWLVKVSPLAIAPNGIFVRSEFRGGIPRGSAQVIIQAQLKNWQTNTADAKVRYQILDPTRKSVAHTERSAHVGPGSENTTLTTLRLASPRLWSPESPQLYTLIATIEAGGKVVDQLQTEFGVRTVAFDADRGFLLNGRPYLIKGTCNHQDHAGVGAALPDRLQYFRVARLKEMGCNAYRTSHNPPTPELLEACDRLGMLVMDENRLLGSDIANLNRLKELVLRDRNHASVVIWSIGNEEGVQTTPAGGRVAESMQTLVHELDPTRPVTYAANVGNTFEGINRIIDVRGWNYHIGEGMDRYHAAHPHQPNVGTEQASTVCTRGIYYNDKARGYVSAYDDNAPPWANTTETWWKFFAARPWLSGGFAWTGFDYRGEPTPYSWPCINSHFGILDTCGFPKDNFYYYQAWWTDRTILHLLPHWTWPGREGQEIDVRCFSNCDEVELVLNGQSVGRQAVPRNSHLRWNVTYAPGTLSARGFKAGRVVIEQKVETTGASAAIKLDADRVDLEASGKDVSVITVSVVDVQGRLVPVANDLISFESTGPGKILGVGNGDPSCHEPDVYLVQPVTRTLPLNSWLMHEVPGVTNRPEVAEHFDDGDWRNVSVEHQFGSLRPDSNAVFRTRFSAGEPDLAAEDILLNFGMIDDDGWVYVNGQLAGESHDWSSAHSFDVKKFVRLGQNTVAVVVKNDAGAGGLSRGVELELRDKPHPAAWQRSVFNGLAQVIVQAGNEPGEIRFRASAAGLQPATLLLRAQPAAAQ